MQGAALVYNLALARMERGREDLAEEIERALAEWADAAQREEVAAWDLDELWSFCAEREHGRPGALDTAARSRVNVTPRTREFVTGWQKLLQANSYRTIGGSTDAQRLVQLRELQLKGARSRFRSERARELWGGSSGTALMTYRWRTARSFLRDLYRGRGGVSDARHRRPTALLRVLRGAGGLRPRRRRRDDLLPRSRGAALRSRLHRDERHGRA